MTNIINSGSSNQFLGCPFKPHSIRINTTIWVTLLDKKDLAMEEFNIEGLDHVAIRVKDMERTAKWYEDVLGLQRLTPEKWDESPIFLMAGQTGIAVFPANFEEPVKYAGVKNVKIDHFAFRVTEENFEKALAKFSDLGIEHNVQNHHYFQSVYLQDPDGHPVELTTLVVAEEEFYA